MYNFLTENSIENPWQIQVIHNTISSCTRFVNL